MKTNMLEKDNIVRAINITIKDLKAFINKKIILVILYMGVILTIQFNKDIHTNIAIIDIYNCKDCLN